LRFGVLSSSDRELVVCHDGTVDRTTDSTGRIADLTLAELRLLDNSYWFVPGADVTPGLDADCYPYRGRAPDDRNFGIATLAEAIAVIDEFPGVVVNLDIKGTAPAVEPYEKLLGEQLRELHRTTDVIVASFSDLATDAFRRFAPEIATSAFWRAAHAGEDPPSIPYVALQVPCSHAGLEVVDEVFVKAAHHCGIAVHVWTVNEEAVMARLLDLGVDGIISDLPTPLCALLVERGATWHPEAGPR
jgi:glycerophosphoryl diester phosphodiesterase